MEGSMRQRWIWIASALFLAIWLGLVGFFTWLAVQDGFLYFPYWISVGVLLAIAAVPLLLCWIEGSKPQQRIASALFLTIWPGLVGFITWFAVQDGFLYFPYWISVGLLLALANVPLLLCWEFGHRHILRIPFLLGIVWLLVLSFVPFNANQALVMRRNQIQIGMTQAQVRAVMSGYRAHKSGFERPAGVEEGLGFCTDDPDCAYSVQVDFVSGRVVRVWYDTD
jgi:hypothetical protein